MRRTVKIKLEVEEQEKLQETIRQFKYACNQVVEKGWNEEGLKTYNKNKLHEETYYQIREETDLPANLVTQARDRASQAIKGCVEKLKDGDTVSKPEFTSDSIKYDKRTFSIWLEDKRATFSTVDRRIEAELLYDEEKEYYQKYLSESWNITSSTLEKHSYEDGEPYYLHLGVEKKVERKEEFEEPRVMGVDLGVDNLAVTSTGKFWSGNKLNHQRRRFEEIRGKLQEKGTRSAHQTIQHMEGRENRYSCDTLHRISKEIVEHAERKDVDVIVFEDLKGIREDISNRKKFQEWCFRKLFKYVEYKAKEKGIRIEKVKSSYTSQKCSECGHTTKGNRKGSKFKCVNCGKEIHSDYNAAKNIGNKFLRNGQKSSMRKSHSQLALKSGTVNLNGDYTAYPVTG
ncbi:MAG: transposase [Candidatus Nanohaloarchaeota archaeon QJJ-9]|nr:transposase [Candidatus Nanohaloarchaeota archaeon QJJ-9]